MLLCLLFGLFAVMGGTDAFLWIGAGGGGCALGACACCSTPRPTRCCCTNPPAKPCCCQTNSGEPCCSSCQQQCCCGGGCPTCNCGGGSSACSSCCQQQSPAEQQQLQSSFPQLISTSDAVAASSSSGAGEPIPILPDQAKNQIQPVIYVIGGTPLVSSSTHNETAGGTNVSSLATADSPGANKSSQMPPNSTEESVNSSNNNGSTKTASAAATTARALVASELIPKVQVRARNTTTTSAAAATEGTAAAGNRPQFDDEEEEQMESQALYDYEERETRKISSNRAAGATTKLLEIEMDLFARRDRLLRKLLKRRMRSSRAKRISNGPTNGLLVCNNKRMSRIMANTIVDEISISKRLVKRALEYSFAGTTFDVICVFGGGAFSYSIYGRRYCEVNRKGVTCVAFD